MLVWSTDFHCICWDGSNHPNNTASGSGAYLLPNHVCFICSMIITEKKACFTYDGLLQAEPGPAGDHRQGDLFNTPSWRTRGGLRKPNRILRWPGKEPTSGNYSAPYQQYTYSTLSMWVKQVLYNLKNWHIYIFNTTWNYTYRAWKRKADPSRWNVQ
jgi:hypothetical protein